MPDFKKNYTKEEAKTLVESLRMVVDFARILTKDEIEGRQNLKNAIAHYKKMLHVKTAFLQLPWKIRVIQQKLNLSMDNVISSLHDISLWMVWSVLLNQQ